MGKKIEDGPIRKRGRPAGKNRIPLSKTERLARNAQYEKERREEIADAMADLADAIGCDRDMRNCNLLAAVVQFIESRAPGTNPVDNADSLRSVNQNLEEQISCLEHRLMMKSQTVSMQPILGSPSMQNMLPTPPSLTEDVEMDSTGEPSTLWAEPANLTSQDVGDSSARTRGYTGRRKTKKATAKLLQSDGSLVEEDPSPLRTEHQQPTSPVDKAAVEPRVCCHQLFSDECLDQCLGMRLRTDPSQHLQPESHMVPQVMGTMEVDFTSVCLGTGGGAMGDPPMQTFWPETPESENDESILPSGVLAFVLEYTSPSWRNPE